MKQLIFVILFTALISNYCLAQFYPLREIEEKTIYSEILQEHRPVLVSKPVGYDSSNENYFVIYVLDGNLNTHFTSGIAELLYQSGYPRLLIVGIPSTQRTKDLTPAAVENTPLGGGADNFMLFLEKELMPYVESQYRTHHYKVLVGHSLGGLFAAYTLLKKPDLFEGYVAITPTVVYNDFQTGLDLISFFENTGKLNKFFFFSVGHEPGAEGDAVFRLKKEVFDGLSPDKLDWKFEYYPRENHSTTPVIATLDGLRFIFRDLVPADDFVRENGFVKTLEYYQRLEEKYSKSIPIPQRVLMNYGYEILKKEKLEKEAFAVFNYYKEKYPSVPVPYDGLALLHRRRKENAKALENLRKLLEIDPAYEDAKIRLITLETEMKEGN